MPLRRNRKNPSPPRAWALHRIVALTMIIGSAAFAPAHEKPDIADTILENARAYTVNATQPWAEAIAVRGEQILAVGSRSEVSRHRGSQTKTIDAGGRLVLPGFTDCHNHFLDGSLALQRVQLDDATNIAEIQRRVKQYASSHPSEPWVLGRGWQYTAVGTSGLPDKKYLDEIVPDRPVYLESFDGHTWWANSKALQAAGVSRSTPDPAGGSFVRDPKTGEPNGTVKEDAADDVVRAAIPPPTHNQILAALLQGMSEANRIGLVRVISPDGVSVRGGDFHALDSYDELRHSGRLTVRLDVALRIQPPDLTAADLKEIQAARERYHDAWIAAGKAKFFLDGVIETRTAAMLEPYSNDPARSGELLWDPEKYRQAVAELDRHGIQIFTHAIGDRAIRLALDSYDNAQRVNSKRDARHRIEHIEDASAQDVPRFGKLGVIASFQPLHAYPDDDVLKVWSENVGPKRAKRGWPFHSVQADGGVLAFGSDWPIVTMNPWAGVQNAVTRQTLDGQPPGGWLPNERVSLEDAIRGYTLNAAFAGHREKTEGSLEPGKMADLIILSQDLFQIEPSKIVKTEVLLTMVGGKVVYQSSAFESAKTPKEAER